ncbi:hypothetical protein L485_00860 [Sphingobium baderi LL03]|uniref:Uncharacterized protein n=1 Tax=Sphingobium baderi LL03 TaxID=1114964 RepID=T0GQK3_9SPHN|nr:hypothetical protein L485_00860 [Sphingobium baderi LL03]
MGHLDHMTFPGVGAHKLDFPRCHCGDCINAMLICIARLIEILEQRIFTPFLFLCAEPLA